MQADPVGLSAIRDQAVAVARPHLAGRVLDDLRLAVSEMASNVVLHAYGEERRGPLDLRIWLEHSRLMVSIRDYGTGLRPRLNSPGLGLGLPTVAQITDFFHVEAHPDGTEVIVGFGLAQ